MKAFGFYGLTTIEKMGAVLARYSPAGRGRGRRVVERLFFAGRTAPRDALIWSGRVKLRLPPASSLKYLIADHRYNKAERAYLRRTIREGDVIADIGANIGFYTLWLAGLKVPGTRIIAVEPNPAVYDALTENVRLNAFENVVTVNAAIGEADRSASFGVIAGAPSVGSLLASDAEQITVQMKTLASALKENGLPRCDVVKIDVEGYEDQALLPYLEATPPARWPRVLLIEQNHRAKQWKGKLVETILQQGYHVALRTHANIILQRN